MRIWEILLCFFSAVGLFSVAWALVGRFLRPPEAGVWIVVDLDKIPQHRWEHTLAFCRWLWNFGILPGPVRLTWSGGESPLFERLLRDNPFVTYDGGEPPREVER